MHQNEMKPPMGWNTWNTFGPEINEKLIMEMADTMLEEGYLQAGYRYIIIDDCWSLRERVNGKLAEDPALFPHGMRYVSDYVHSKGFLFGMYSCAGFMTCAGYPSSYGHEFDDARQFAEWGVDYLKYDFCNFPASGDAKNAYLTMAMALRSSGRDIKLAACNWGVDNPSAWMRSHGAYSYRSTGDIFDVPKSYKDLFLSQIDNVEHNGPGCYNDMDMLIVGMHGKGNVGLGGCSNQQYLQHFAMWAFMGSPLIIGTDLRSLDEECKSFLLNPNLIAINQDDDCRPCFTLRVNNEKTTYTMAKLLSGNRIALAYFNIGTTNAWEEYMYISFDDLGIHSESGMGLHLIDAITGEDLGIRQDGLRCQIPVDGTKILIGQVVKAN